MSAFVAILSARGDYYCEHRGKRQCCCELFHHILGPAHDILLMLYELVILREIDQHQQVGSRAVHSYFEL